MVMVREKLWLKHKNYGQGLVGQLKQLKFDKNHGYFDRRYVKGDELQKSDTSLTHPLLQPAHPDNPPSYLQGTPLPVLALNDGTGYKGQGAESSNMEVIPMDTGLSLAATVDV